MTRQWLTPVTGAFFLTSAIAACSSGNSSTEKSSDAGLAFDVDNHKVTAGDAGVDVARTPDATAGTDAPVVVSDSSTSHDAGTYDALPAPPQVTNAGGGVLATPTIVAIFFSNEDQTMLPTFEQFYMGLPASSLWQAASEYGVGAATVQIVNLTEAAPTTIDDTNYVDGNNTALEQWLQNEITAGTLPAVTPNIEYMINYPSDTTVTAGGTQCQDFDGYHADMQDPSSKDIAYGVIPRCTDYMSTVIDTFTSTVSHEAIEAATDPWPYYSPGWVQADNPHLFFDEANDGSEVADMCENDPEAYYQFSDLPFVVQRFWSNKSALAGHDPCVPEIPGAVFYNAVPELPDTGLFAYEDNTITVSSIKIPVGGTGTVYLDLYSDGTIPDWDVNVVDYNYFYTGDTSSTLLTIDQPITTGNNGSRLAVNITVKASGDPNSTTVPQVANTELFAIVSSQGTSDTSPAHYWYGIVTN